LTHTGFEFDIAAAASNSLRFGMGFGIYGTNIDCPSCTVQYTSGIGYSLSLIKIGFTLERLSLYYGHYTLSGQASSTGSGNAATEYQYSWEATMGMFSLVYIF
jgi:hypothetical protein